MSTSGSFSRKSPPRGVLPSSNCSAKEDLVARFSSLRSARLFSRELPDVDIADLDAPASLRKNSLVEAFLKKNDEGRPEDFFEKSLLGHEDTKEIASVLFGSEVLIANAYIIATGGLSHPETGSTGDGFEWLRDLGHTVVDPTPTIVPLAVGDEGMGRLIKKLSGTTLKQAKITFFVDGVKKFAREGDILCTHFGLSGPTILNAAGKVAELLKEGEVTARIDLYPKKDLGALDQEVLALFELHKNKDVDNALADMLPTALTREGIKNISFAYAGNEMRNVSTSTVPKVHSFFRDDRKKFVHTLKNLHVEITGLLGFDKAVVADGGVPLSEIDMETFASKKVDNLYITGDLLHINRPSGGYSLQLCWTSGYVAGSSA
jgi:predicted Rossmann fold flavoprotein